MSKLQQQVDALNRDKLRFEVDILKRLEENKEFAAKSTKALVDASCRDVIARIEAEFAIASHRQERACVRSSLQRVPRSQDDRPEH